MRLVFVPYRAQRDPMVPLTRSACRIGILALCGAFLAGCTNLGPGPVGWPQPPQAAMTAAAQRTLEAPSDEATLSALEAKDTDPVRAKLPPRSGRNVDREYRRAARRVRRLGARVGVLEARVHDEDGRRVVTALTLYRKRSRLTKLVFQWSFDGEGRFDLLSIRPHPWPDEIGEIAEDYLSVNRFRFPLVGEWDVLHGGRTPDVNKHFNHVQQRWAFDFVIREGGELRAAGSKSNESYYGHGGTIVAPAPGVVVFSRDGMRENRPGRRGKLGGNGVVIDHGFGEFTAHWHMITGTVTAQVGDRVEYGQALGKVGNSGRSTMPHLHVHLVSAAPGESPQALPLEFHDVVVDGVPQRRSMPPRPTKVRQRADGDPQPARDKRPLFDL